MSYGEKVKFGFNKWDLRFMTMAELVASWSKDPSTKVGAVITDPNNRIVSTGFNGPARNVEDVFKSREQKLMRTIHAEENAILFAQTNLGAHNIYITHPPCARCAAKIIQVGIFEVYFKKPSEDFLSRWKDDYEETLLQFKESEVDVFILGD